MTSAALASAPFIRLAINSDLSRIIDHLPATRPLVAIGDYWFVTPLVYERIRVQGNQETYLISFRTRRETVRHLVESGRSFTLVYVVIKADDCKSHNGTVERCGRFWPTVHARFLRFVGEWWYVLGAFKPQM